MLLFKEYQLAGVKFWKGIVLSPALEVVANEKGAFGLPTTAVVHFTLLISVLVSFVHVWLSKNIFFFKECSISMKYFISIILYKKIYPIKQIKKISWKIYFLRKYSLFYDQNISYFKKIFLILRKYISF